MPVAYNASTGQALYLDNGAWKPAHVAVNPKTGAKVAFDGKQWTPLGGTPATTGAQPSVRGTPGGEETPSNKIVYRGKILPIDKDAAGHLHFDVRTGLAGMIFSGITAPGDALAGRIKPDSKEEIERAANLGAIIMPDAAGIGASASPGISVKPKIAASDLRKAATDIYENPQVRKQAVPLEALGKTARAIKSKLKTFSTDDPENGPVFKILDKIDKYAKGKAAGPNSVVVPSIDTLDNWSGQLGKIAKKTQIGRAGPEPTSGAAAASIAKRYIDDLLAEHSPAWRVADQNYSAYKIADALDRRAVKARIQADGGTASFADKMKGVATKILSDDRLTKGMTDADKNRLRSIQRGTATQRSLAWLSTAFGNRVKYGILPIVGGVGGYAAAHDPIGATAGALLGGAIEKGARSAVTGIRNVLADRQAKALVGDVVERSPAARAIPPVIRPRLLSRDNPGAALLSRQGWPGGISFPMVAVQSRAKDQKKKSAEDVKVPDQDAKDQKNGSGHDTASTRRKFNSILNDPQSSKGFSKEELSHMRKWLQS